MNLVKLPRYVLFLSAFLSWAMLAVSSAQALEPVRIGVLAFRPKTQTLAQWQPLVTVLKLSMPDRDFVVEPMVLPEMEQAIQSRRIDFVMTNPGHYILMSRRYGLGAPLATMIGQEAGKAASAFGGVIFTLANRDDIQTLEDLNQKTIAAVSVDSMGGYQVQAYELFRRDIKLEPAQMLYTGMPQDQTVDRVLNKKADAAFVRTGVLEKMAREGKLDLSAIKVINPQHLPGFPQALSTRLYPEWPFAPLPNTDPGLSRRVAAALLLLEDLGQVTHAMDIRGFGVPADYSPVEEMLRDLRAPPFDKAPIFTWHDVWARYQAWIVLLFSAFGLVLLLGARLYLSRRNLAEAYRRVAHQTEQLKLSASVFEHSYDGILITDPSNVIVDVNPAFVRITGYTKAEAVGQQPAILRSGQNTLLLYQEMWRALNTQDFWQGEIWNKRKNGEVYAQMLAITAVRDAAGQLAHYVAVFSDISALKAHQAELDRMAHFDPLTGVPNRRLLSDRLDQAIARSQRNAKPMAVCYLDLDGFKPVNDRFGHEAGDHLLVEITHRLKRVLRSDDTLARLGGDEFVLLFGDLDGVDDLSVLNRVLDAVVQPVDIKGQAVSVSASIGVALYPEDDVDADTLLRHADQAMYTAKQAGKNCYFRFDPSRDQQTQERFAAQRDIIAAIKNHEMVLYYQPKIDLRTGKVLGVEALIRWQHPERGLLSPALFLPLIEDSEAEVTLGQWVIDRALGQYDDWRAAGLDLQISVNISGRHLQWSGFVDDLKKRLQQHPAALPGGLEIEVLETSALEDFQWVANVITDCENLGVSFALDDFGTGYSSLTYLRNLPAKTLKIDQTFVGSMLADQGDRAIVEGVVALARTFNRITLAEGAETVEHLRVLMEMGCDGAQGYAIAKPMPADQVLGWCQAYRPLLACHAEANSGDDWSI